MKVKPRKISWKLSPDVPPPTLPNPDLPFPPSDCGSTKEHKVHVMISTTESLQDKVDKLALRAIHAAWNDQEEKLKTTLNKERIDAKNEIS